MTRGKLICLTGPAGAGKDTLALELLTHFLERGHRMNLLSGSSFFRTTAAYVVSLGYDGKETLPMNIWDDIRIQISELEGEKIGEVVHSNRVIGRYLPSHYMQIEVGTVGSNLAQQLASRYKEFVIGSIREQIRANSEEGVHTLFPARDSFALAASLDSKVEVWCGYIDASVEVRIKRLRERYNNRGDEETVVERKVREELQRDEQDRRSGTLPPKPTDFIDIKTRQKVTMVNDASIIIYYLDTSELTIPMAAAYLATTLQNFFSYGHSPVVGNI